MTILQLESVKILWAIFRTVMLVEMEPPMMHFMAQGVSAQYWLDIHLLPQFPKNSGTLHKQL